MTDQFNRSTHGGESGRHHSAYPHGDQPSSVRPLHEVLAYRNDDVVERFTGQYAITSEESEDIFHETKKWLWLSAQPDASHVTIVEPLWIIDEMWHNFVLFTRDYMDFCRSYFEIYLHHVPVTGRAKEGMAMERAEAPEVYADIQAARQRAQCEYIHRKLGEATLLKWYVAYPLRYDTEFVARKRVAPIMEWQPSELLCALHTGA